MCSYVPEGSLDDCCCDVSTVRSLNSGGIHEKVKALLENKFFQFYSVNLDKGCKFWPDAHMCIMKDCQVAECDLKEVPVGLVEKCGMVDVTDEANKLDTSHSFAEMNAFAKWVKYDNDRPDSFCAIDDDDPSSLHYYNLKKNPERFTGYAGESANRIWRAVYTENCFKPENGEFLTSETIKGMCLEKRVFYRVVSGLHASIGMQLCADHYNAETKTWGPDLQCFVKKFSPKFTYGQGKEYLKNLVFAYTLVLRAVAKAAPFLEQYDFYTGHPLDDTVTRQLAHELLEVSVSCPSTFDESFMFHDKNGPKLKEEFRTKFKNITRIMDCVGCEKCRLWGKLQTQGLATAMRVLFSPSAQLVKGSFQMSRNEVVALFQVFGKLSSSVDWMERFVEMQEEQEEKNKVLLESSENDILKAVREKIFSIWLLGHTQMERQELTFSSMFAQIHELSGIGFPGGDESIIKFYVPVGFIAIFVLAALRHVVRAPENVTKKKSN
eukprot:Nk52_evm24s745 gene=Nk52_evmTU24s745